MKALKLVLPSLGLLLTFAMANAKSKPDNGLFTKTHAIVTYVDAMTRGQLDGFEDVVDPSATFTTLGRNNQCTSYSKGQMLGFLKKIGKLEENCITETAVVENCTEMIVVRVDMKFDNFTRSNFVGIADTGKGWKIINVYTVYQVRY
jgi:hypothetical protein